MSQESDLQELKVVDLAHRVDHLSETECVGCGRLNTWLCEQDKRIEALEASNVRVSDLMASVTKDEVLARVRAARSAPPPTCGTCRWFKQDDPSLLFDPKRTGMCQAHPCAWAKTAEMTCGEHSPL